MRKAPSPEVLGPVRHEGRLADGQTLELGDLQRKQLAFREINVKEAFTIVDAEGAFFRASRKSDDQALVYERMSGSTESPACVTLVCAVLARQRMITVIQKATELGCVRVVPVMSDHAVQEGELEKEKPWAWPGQALRAARQCRRATIPEVLQPTSFTDALVAPWFRGARARFVLDDRAARGVDPFAGLGAGEYVLAVGPEGGWSDAERKRLEEAGVVALALGARVLRAETAVYVGLALLQHRLGDLR
jgi:16S rRNA (uracil1498-N3)-methyltransferase